MSDDIPTLCHLSAAFCPCNHSCASLAWSGRRGGIASAVGAAARSRRRAGCGTASPRAPAPSGAPAVAGSTPPPRVAGPPCPVVCLPPHGRERASRDSVASTARDTPGGGRRRREEVTARLDAWVEAHKRLHLSDLPLQMARALGLNPKPCGGLVNHRQKPWELPLPACIAECDVQRLHWARPAKVVSLAEAAKRQQPSACDQARHPRERTDT
jgi:hypothetical protein